MMYPFEFSFYTEDFVDSSSPLALSTIEALVKGLDMVRGDAELYKDDNHGDDDEEFSFEFHVFGFFQTYETIDFDTAVAAFKAIEPNPAVIKRDTKAIIKLCNAQLIRELPDGHPIVQRYQTVMRKYKLDDAFAPLFPFIDIVYEEIMKRTPGLNLTCEFKYFSKSTIYKNLKNEYDLPGILAILPRGQKYGGFVKAFLHLHYLYRARKFAGYESLTFTEIVCKDRTQFLSTVYSDEQRLNFFEKLAISSEDCKQWSETFDDMMPKFKNIHKFFGQIE